MTSKIFSMVDCNDVRIHTFGVLLEAMKRLNSVFDRSLRDELGISQSFFEALLRISRSGGHMSMGDLAGQIALSSGGVTRLVDRMIDKDLVERRSCPTDRRVLWVAITESGTAMLEAALDVHLRDLETEINSRITEAERTTLIDVMERLREPAATEATG